MMGHNSAGTRWIILTAILAMSLAGCLEDPADPVTGVRLADRTVCEGNFTDGTPVHCEQRAERAIPQDSVPAGWIPTYGPSGGHDSTFYRFLNPEGPVGTFRLGYSYEVDRGAIDPEISLDPIHGVAWHVSWERPVWWESEKSAFVEFPEPIPHGSGDFYVALLHPHAIAMNTSLFNVSIETPVLHDKLVEPLWDVQGDEIKVVHKVHGAGGPYYFHEGQPDTGTLGRSISQSGVDYSIMSRLIILEGMTFGFPP